MYTVKMFGNTLPEYDWHDTCHEYDRLLHF